jgi:prophage regulatory protein
MPEHPTLLTRREVLRRTGLGKTKIHQLEAVGEFPSRIKLGEGSVGYYEHEIDLWIKQRIRAGGRRMPPGCRGAEPKARTKRPRVYL